MRKIGISLLTVITLILCYFTFSSAGKVFRSDWDVPERAASKVSQYRLVLITQELDTPFWDKVGAGAKRQAEDEGASLEVWGSYGKNQEDFLKKVEIAIHSKVDGIIVQGLDSDEFKNLTKVKAAFYGIPIITVANDVPMTESLRRTYVGSDQYMAGRMIAKQIVSDIDSKGKIILMSDSRHEYYQNQRLTGMQDVFKDYPNIKIINAETTEARDQIIATTRDMLNKTPDADGFIAVNANIAGSMIQEISRRSQVEPFHIYTFDDAPDSLSLLMRGQVDGVIEQSPEEMGIVSVNLIMKWLRNETVPLDKNGYLTDIRMLKAMDRK
ncbi:sugar ABC transporter substrate-binding protein [Mesobacillus boroniphilus]|uniref:Sugar ABC transporter substrate-binding protein n=1 Tax=Mesobacillus boroniphilus TaxID=308892 RepID=A0A944GXW9_9BACI|nr:substrate-binding domain-containing protein [Mesobacillus boroniphilus]MBS8266227.1 sugar ABC transporter substrate-binding protein [Mesobacillus boroniphilus]